MGRRRKSSTSTVGQVDQVRTFYNKESALLKPHANVDDPEWPVFILSDAVIYEKDGKTVGNPLLVDHVGPMVIRGRLGVEEDNEEALAAFITPKAKSANIEITGSTNYSIGYTPTGLWVSGSAGWFEIRPAPEYEAMYLEIREAITLFFEAQICYTPYSNSMRRSGKQKKKKPLDPPSLDDVLLQYATGVGDGVTRDEAEARYIKWSHFLAGHFPKDGVVSWEGTPFAAWIKEHDSKKPKPQPKAAEPVSDAGGTVSNSERLSARSRSRSARASQQPISQDVEMVDLSVSSSSQNLPIRKGKENALAETPVPIPAYYNITTQPATSQPKPVRSASPQAASAAPSLSALDTPADRLLDVLEEIASTRDIARKGLKAKTAQTQSYLKCRISKYPATPEVLAYYAQDLLPLLDSKWKNTEFYGWLKQIASKPRITPEHISLDKIEQATYRRQKAPERAPKPTDADNDSSRGSQPPNRNRKSGKGAVLRPYSKKRPAGDTDLNLSDSDGGRGRGGKFVKKSRLNDFGALDDSEEEDEATSNADSVLEELSGDTATAGLIPLPKDAIPIVVHAEKIPSMSPAGPNGTWTCDQEGCAYVVRAADDQAGQERIVQHFREHERQQKKIDLALKESRGHLPINHLLEKIQAKGQTNLQKKAGLLDGQTLPLPIKRKLLF